VKSFPAVSEMSQSHPRASLRNSIQHSVTENIKKHCLARRLHDVVPIHAQRSVCSSPLVWATNLSEISPSRGIAPISVLVCERALGSSTYTRTHKSSSPYSYRCWKIAPLVCVRVGVCVYVCMCVCVCAFVRLCVLETSSGWVTRPGCDAPSPHCALTSHEGKAGYIHIDCYYQVHRLQLPPPFVFL